MKTGKLQECIFETSARILRQLFRHSNYNIFFFVCRLKWNYSLFFVLLWFVLHSISTNRISIPIFSTAYEICVYVYKLRNIRCIMNTAHCTLSIWDFFKKEKLHHNLLPKQESYIFYGFSFKIYDLHVANTYFLMNFHWFCRCWRKIFHLLVLFCGSNLTPCFAKFQTSVWI